MLYVWGGGGLGSGEVWGGISFGEVWGGMSFGEVCHLGRYVVWGGLSKCVVVLALILTLSVVVRIEPKT